MTADEFKQVLATMKMSQRRSAAAFGVDERTIRRWASGETSIPPTAAILAAVYEDERAPKVASTEPLPADFKTHGVYPLLEVGRLFRGPERHADFCREILTACVNSAVELSPVNAVWASCVLEVADRYDGSENSTALCASTIWQIRDIVSREVLLSAFTDAENRDEAFRGADSPVRDGDTGVG